MISIACREDDRDNYKNIIDFRDRKDKYTFKCEEEEEEEHDVEEYNDNCAKKDICDKVCSNCRGNNDPLIYPFHKCSRYIYTWLTEQKHVKEESITDWLFYEISQKSGFIYCHDFSRHAESKNGSDWEWWILTKDNSGIHKFYAYRFLVQSKKLLSPDKDNYPLINYSNKYGMQVDLLLDSAGTNNALPLYMYYSTGDSDVLEQIKNVTYINEDALYWCEKCINGCYLSLARVVYDLLYKTPRRKILDYELLNNSFKLSILDLLQNRKSKDIASILEQFNNDLIENSIVNESIYFCSDVKGIQHNEKSIPQYLDKFIEKKGKNLSWLEKDMRIDNIAGLGVIDLTHDKSD